MRYFVSMSLNVDLEHKCNQIIAKLFKQFGTLFAFPMIQKDVGHIVTLPIDK